MTDELTPLGKVLSQANFEQRTCVTGSDAENEGHKESAETNIQTEGQFQEHDPSGLELASQIAATTASAGATPGYKKSRPRRAASKRKKSTDFVALGDAVNNLIQRRGWQRGVDLNQLLTDWVGLVGEANAQHSKPEAYIDEVLTIRADSTAWATNLRLLAPKLVAKLNAELGQGTVKRVEILGPSGPTWKHGLRVVRDGRGPRDTYG